MINRATWRMKEMGMKTILKTALVVGLLTGCGAGEYSDGERSGTVTKISKKGLFWKTWEGCLALTQSAESCWDFSVPDESFVSALQEASKKGTRVQLKYSQRILPAAPWQSSTQYWITGISEQQ